MGTRGLRHPRTTEHLSVPAWGGGATGPSGIRGLQPGREPWGRQGRGAGRVLLKAPQAGAGLPGDGGGRRVWALPAAFHPLPAERLGKHHCHWVSPTHDKSTHCLLAAPRGVRTDRFTPTPRRRASPSAQSHRPLPSHPRLSRGQSYLPRGSALFLGTPPCYPEWSPLTTVPSFLGTSGPVPALVVLSGGPVHRCLREQKSPLLVRGAWTGCRVLWQVRAHFGRGCRTLPGGCPLAHSTSQPILSVLSLPRWDGALSPSAVTSGHGPQLATHLFLFVASLFKSSLRVKC